MSAKLGEDFSFLAESLINEQALFKLMQIANGVMAEQAHHCMLCILDNCRTVKVVELVMRHMSSNRK